MRKRFRPFSTVWLLAGWVAFLPGAAEAQDASAVRDVGERLTAAMRRFDREAAAARKDLLDALARIQRAAKERDLAERCEADRQAFETAQLLPASAPAEARTFERALLRSAERLEDAYTEAVTRYRALGEAAAADRADAELTDLCRRHAALREQDLRAQVILKASTTSMPSSWAWQQGTLINAAEAPAALRLPPPESDGFPAAYLLTLEVARLQGEGELLLAFPLTTAGRRSLGLLALRPGEVQLVGGGSDELDVIRDKALLSADAPVSVTIEVDAAGTSVQLGGAKVLTADRDTAMPIPEELRPVFADATTAHLWVSQGMQCRIRRILFAPAAAPPREAQAAEAAAPPAPLLPEDSEWKGSWDGSGVQDGDCRSMVVVARDGKAATLDVTTNRGAVFRFELEIKGKAIRVTNMIHRKSAGREILALSDVHGSGAVTKDGFSFSFTVRRSQAKRRDNWQGTIKATRAN